MNIIKRAIEKTLIISSFKVLRVSCRKSIMQWLNGKNILAFGNRVTLETWLSGNSMKHLGIMYTVERRLLAHIRLASKVHR